ncbi:hypothetical protein ASPVEDRAFT_185405, partial [Aspergillus versicolor CBS 583.65]
PDDSGPISLIAESKITWWYVLLSSTILLLLRCFQSGTSQRRRQTSDSRLHARTGTPAETNDCHFCAGAFSHSTLYFPRNASSFPFD